MLSSKVSVKFLKLENVSIFEQLILEEYLLRDTQENICLINSGSPPAIVLGISGKPEELVEIEKAQKLELPLIKRFSGGGTVVIDQNTLFVTFIFNADAVAVPGFPEAIYDYISTLYAPIFEGLPFEFRQNDYVLKDRKVGGNAQYIKKNRWLHHTSFLWDYDPLLMSCLKHPLKKPAYRQDRDHEAFICRLKDYLSTPETFFTRLRHALSHQFELSPFEGKAHPFIASRLSTTYLSDQNPSFKILS